MKNPFLFLLALVGLVGVAPAAVTTTYTTSPGIGIPDANPGGISSSINVNGLSGGLLEVNVYLNVSGGYNGDLYAYLTYNNTLVAILNRAGRTTSNPFGYTDAGFNNVKFSDAGATDIHLYGGNGGAALTGTWQPDRRTGDPLTVTDASTRGNGLSAYNGMDGNGEWKLFFADMASGGTSTLNSWTLELTVVPEPIPTAMMLFGAVFGGYYSWRRWVRKA